MKVRTIYCIQCLIFIFSAVLVCKAAPVSNGILFSDGLQKNADNWILYSSCSYDSNNGDPNGSLHTSTSSGTEGYARAKLSKCPSEWNEWTTQFDVKLNESTGGGFQIFAPYDSNFSSGVDIEITVDTFDWVSGTEQWDFHVIDNNGSHSITLRLDANKWHNFIIYRRGDGMVELWVNYSLINVYKARNPTKRYEQLQIGDSSSGSKWGDVNWDNIKVGELVKPCIYSPNDFIIGWYNGYEPYDDMIDMHDNGFNTTMVYALGTEMNLRDRYLNYAEGTLNNSTFDTINLDEYKRIASNCWLYDSNGNPGDCITVSTTTSQEGFARLDMYNVPKYEYTTYVEVEFDVKVNANSGGGMRIYDPYNTDFYNSTDITITLEDGDWNSGSNSWNFHVIDYYGSTSESVDLDASEWHNFKIRRITNDTIDMYVDGIYIDRYKNITANVSVGEIQIGDISQGFAYGDVSWDNFKIRDLSTCKRPTDNCWLDEQGGKTTGCIAVDSNDKSKEGWARLILSTTEMLNEWVTEFDLKVDANSGGSFKLYDPYDEGFWNKVDICLQMDLGDGDPNSWSDPNYWYIDWNENNNTWSFHVIDACDSHATSLALDANEWHHFEIYRKSDTSVDLWVNSNFIGTYWARNPEKNLAEIQFGDIAEPNWGWGTARWDNFKVYTPSSQMYDLQLFSDNFSSGNLLKWSTVDGNCVYDSNAGNDSGCLKIQTDSSDNGYAKVEIGNLYDTIEWTTEFDVKVNASTGGGFQIFAPYNANSANDVDIKITVETFDWVSSLNKWDFHVTDSTGSSSITARLDANEWHNFKITRNNNIVDLWVDNEFINTYQARNPTEKYKILQIGDTSTTTVWGDVYFENFRVNAAENYSLFLELPSSDVRNANLNCIKKFVNKYKDRDSVFMWQLDDEPSSNNVDVNNFIASYNEIKNNDSNHLVSAVFCDDELGNYINGIDLPAFDMYPCFYNDTYPAPQLYKVAKGIKKIAKQASDANKLPPIYVAQAFMDPDGSPPWYWRLPSHFETRYMTFAPFTVGAQGIMYWLYAEKLPGFTQGTGQRSTLEQREMVVYPIASQLTSLIPALTSDDGNGNVTVSTNHDSNSVGGQDINDITCIIRKLEDCNDYYLIAVNNTGSNINDVNFTLINFPNASYDIETLYEYSPEFTFDSNILTDDFINYEVHLYHFKEN